MSSMTVRKKKRVNINRVAFILAMIAIPIMHFLVFYVYINANSFFLAFQRPKTGEFTLDNFRLFWMDLTDPQGEINLAVTNTTKFFLLNFVMLFLNFIVAFFFYKKIAGYKFFRIVFYLPAIIAGVAMTTVFTEFTKSSGPIGVLLAKLGHPLKAGGLLMMPGTAIKMVMLYVIWTGFTSNVLLFGGSLSRIPGEILEAAKLDGCSFWREAFSIVLPMVWPMFSTMLVVSCTSFVSYGGQVLLLTAESTSTAKTTTLSYWLFNQVYGGGAYGGSGTYGVMSAAGMCFSAVIIPLTLFVKWLTERIPTVEY